MSKVHPQGDIVLSSSLPSTCSSSKREIFTIWMKSLVMQGNGCTVYNSNGQVVYRIDNYDNKNCNEVYLMDLKGKVLLTILRKKLRLFGRWEGYKSGNGSKGKPSFQVRKKLNSNMEVNDTEANRYRMEMLKGSSSKLACKIMDVRTGRVIAELKPKQSSGGVLLGDDVMGLVVEPNVDHSFIMGLIVVHGLISHKM
ncbi:hypothetical protein C5167_027661 [Papaver somniferum]|uniref:protein LURP-one-related 11-like n=1 Tax=Papaver somniferum TaxID=3469 RepID=UPI000E6FC82E|nr:protein LURP-one-related 11-like [Papaver somniferum]RZC91600.1 hypothetical protein C5167_027661 [Papaver somniferum]